ncbi:FecR family protein [Draconibacterium sediminis]|uniref:Anti-sigma factor n=1 Tax=Draconibacterium sediminis TaxID=1544798 RepID=A0A0D8JF51_9BACT|nr:FecR domain-containing protein [Draconibacterium sediminis]KJF45181.1 anti-sigma factor [Draconibacterium sediminis]
MNKEKLHKFALNQLVNQTEIEEIVSWIEASAENKEEFETLKNLWAIAGFANYDSYVSVKQGKVVSLNRKRSILLSLTKYAAIFVLAFLVGSISVYLIGKQEVPEYALNEIIVPEGESAEVYLSDNTHVWLNSGTKLTYPAQFDGETRDVQLSGEAYFDVTHNSENPFHVKTTNLTVKVLGTSFNMEAYEEARDVNITLVEGKINLQNNAGEVLTELAPGENAEFNLTQKKINISKVDTEFYTSWKDGYLVFKDETLEEIAEKFERWYNVNVVFDDEKIKQLRYTGTILKSKPIDQVLEILKYTTGIEYSIEIINNKPSIIHLKNKPM